MGEEHKLKVSADTKNLVTIASFIEKVLRHKHLESDIVEEVLVAVDEAATNVIKHSYKSKPEGYLRIILKTNKSKIEVSIFDSGNIFDPKKVPMPDLSRDLGKRQLGGMGMFLMKKFMDDVTYSFKGIGGRRENEVHMVKYIK